MKSGPTAARIASSTAKGEAQAVVEAAAVLVVAAVGGGRPEAVHQVAVGLDLDAVEAGRLHALGGVGVVGDDAGEVPVLGLLGEGAVGRLAHRRGRQHRQPVALFQPVRRPRWVSWIITAAPCSWQSSARRFSQGTISSL
jgi:hypothetical protein